MNHSSSDAFRELDAVLGKGPHVVLLRHLCRAGGAHTGRALGRATALSHNAVHRTLKPLVALGVIEADPHGRSLVYRLNEDYWLVREGLRPLFAAEAKRHALLGEVVREAAGVPVRSVILFGSEVRGQAGPDSDIDLLCLTRAAKDQEAATANLASAAHTLRRQFGRRPSVLVWSASDFLRRYRARDRLAREIVDTGWVIAGSGFSEVLK